MLFSDDFVGVNDSKESLQKLIDVYIYIMLGTKYGFAQSWIAPCNHESILRATIHGQLRQDYYYYSKVVYTSH